MSHISDLNIELLSKCIMNEHTSKKLSTVPQFMLFPISAENLLRNSEMSWFGSYKVRA